MDKAVVVVIALVIIYQVFGLFTSKESPNIEEKTSAEMWASYGESGALDSWPGSTTSTDISSSLTAKNYYVVVDGSGSMAETGCSFGRRKMSVAKEALTRFIDKIPSTENIGLYVFDGYGSREVVPIGSTQHENIKSQVDAIRAGGGTPLGQAVDVGKKALTQQGKRQLGYGEYHLVVITDGKASDSSVLNMRVRSLLSETPITVHTIGFCIKSNHTLNQPGYTVYRAADNQQALDSGLDMVLAEAETFDVSAFEGQ